MAWPNTSSSANIPSSFSKTSNADNQQLILLQLMNFCGIKFKKYDKIFFLIQILLLKYKIQLSSIY